MTRKEDNFGALRLEAAAHTLVDTERQVVGDFIENLAGSYCDGLRGVEYAVLPAGEYADYLNNHRSKPDRIDLRIVPDAPPGSTMRELYIDRLENFVRGFLDDTNLPYIQKSGMRWHTVRSSHSDDSKELIQVESMDQTHSICFEVDADPVSKRRAIGVVINNFGDRDLVEHLKWEKQNRQRLPIMLLDTKSPRKRIKF